MDKQMEFCFFVEGQPVPKQSFRAGGRNGGHADPRVKAWQNGVGWDALRERRRICPGDVIPLAGLPVSVELDFFLVDHRRVDLDNLSKGVLDGLKGVLFIDDSQVMALRLRKFIAPAAPGVLIKVMQADPDLIATAELRDYLAHHEQPQKQALEEI